MDHRYLIGAMGLTLLLGTSPSLAQETPSRFAETLESRRIIVGTTSGAAELALAAHLQAIGAVLYKAYWCPHCYAQAQLFGAAAFAQLPQVECAEDGVNAQPQLCQEEMIRAYPTWEINGQQYRGVQSLEALAELSNYQGSRQFTHTSPSP
jgi:thiol-disulfide isomerase/thioredoxin